MIALKEKPPAIPAAEGFRNQTKIYRLQHTTIYCLCGQDFQPGQDFVNSEAPVITITRLCASCLSTLPSDSFAERGERARLLLARTKGGAQ